MDLTDPRFFRIDVEYDMTHPVLIKAHVYSLTLLNHNVGVEWVCGIDPGDVNMGIAFMRGNAARLIQLEFVRVTTAVERIQNTIRVVEWLCDEYAPAGIYQACVEYAAFGKPFGQVSLAENRSGAVVALLNQDTDHIHVIPPGTIRKAVFGSAKLKAEELWLPLSRDAASAFACAWWAVRTK